MEKFKLINEVKNKLFQIPFTVNYCFSLSFGHVTISDIDFRGGVCIEYHAN